MSGFQVRRAVNADFSFIQKFVGDARAAKEPWALSWSELLVRDELKKSDVFVMTAEEGTFAGFLCLRPPGHAWEITLIAVEPRFRGRSGARDLIFHVATALKLDKRAASSSSLALEVRADNVAAIRTYESCGFQLVGRRRGYYSDGADALLYTKA